ncbi:MAG: hypothetical protein EBX40_04085 [Gammaproteobacteria bacterium]|nr:hypothetical protein [Gammaproteobacteria bacterium]
MRRDVAHDRIDLSQCDFHEEDPFLCLARGWALLRSKLDITEKRDNERRAADDKRRKEELDFLKYQGQHLDSFLKQMNSSK